MHAAGLEAAAGDHEGEREAAEAALGEAREEVQPAALTLTLT